MPIVMIMKWDGVSLEQYEEVRALVDWDHDLAPGGLLHVCTHDGTALRITDVWERAEDFDNFVSARLMPAVAKVGAVGEPQVEIYPAHNVFTPGYAPKTAKTA